MMRECNNSSLNKSRIMTAFNKSAKTYDDYCFIQKKAMTCLVGLLVKYGVEYDVIADFACGSGLCCQQLATIFSYNKLYAIDFSEKLLALAKNKILNKRIEFKLADFDETLFDERKINLAFCNMGLQWSQNIVYTLKLFNSYLARAGILAFSLPLDGTLHEIDSFYVNPTYKGTYIQYLLNQLDFEVLSYKNYVFSDKYNSAMDAFSSIKSVGANCSVNYRADNASSGLQTNNKINKLFKDLNNITLTYNIGIFIAIKN